MKKNSQYLAVNCSRLLRRVHKFFPRVRAAVVYRQLEAVTESRASFVIIFTHNLLDVVTLGGAYDTGGNFSVGLHGHVLCCSGW